MQDGDVLLSGKVFQVVHRVQIDADGNTHSRQIIHHPGAVVLLPLLDDGRVVLIRNYRIAANQRLVSPAGTLDPGEEPLQAAGRELAEETGYHARRLELLSTIYSSPGILDERMHLFLATGLTAGPTDLQGGEDIQPLVVAWPKAWRRSAKGKSAMRRR